MPDKLRAAEDDDWDEWIALSDDQQDAIMAREMAEHVKWFNALTPLQQYRSRRRRSLETCAGWRRHIKALDLPVLREYLRATQRSLLKARVDFFHGVRGGVQ